MSETALEKAERDEAVKQAYAWRGELAQARQQLVDWWERQHRCPCGARPDTHPHVLGCPTAQALKEEGT